MDKDDLGLVYYCPIKQQDHVLTRLIKLITHLQLKFLNSMINTDGPFIHYFEKQIEIKKIVARSPH